jgi:hypothetical protein
MTGDSLPSGRFVAITLGGQKCTVGTLGALVGFVVVEKSTREPLQYLSATSDPKELIERWDRVIDTKVRRSER